VRSAEQVIFSTDLTAVDWTALKRDLAADHFDNGRSSHQLRESFENSFAVVFARNGDRIIGKARVISDGVCNAYIVDVWTHSGYRRRGIATKMIRMLLEKLDGQHVYLFTDDFPQFYEKLGFIRQGVGMGIVVGTWLRHA
jgi:predicted GNAT family acetyltransferase